MKWVTREKARVDRIGCPWLIARDDHDNMRLQFPLYDALYAHCRETAPAAAGRRVLFACLHGAAKSVVAATHFRRLAGARGLAVTATAVGTEPEAELTPGRPR